MPSVRPSVRLRHQRARTFGLPGALLLILVSFLALGAVGAPAAVKARAELSHEPAAGAEPAGAVELPGKRTATSRTFELPNGYREARLYESPVNYRSADGKWQRIDQQLRPAGDGTIANGANGFDVKLPAALDSEPITLSRGGRWVSERPLDADLEAADLKGHIASYEGGGNAPVYNFSGLANGLKETITLPDAGAGQNLRFRLDASPGVEPRLEADGSIGFRAGDGEQVAELPAPTMYDSAADPTVSNAIHYSLTDAGDHWVLTVVPDSTWLDAPQRVWPVIIDPSIVVNSPNLDCGISNGPFSEYSLCGTTGWAYSGAFAKYKESGPDEYARSLYRFDLSAIPAYASISSAAMSVYAPSEARNVYWVNLLKVTSPWTTAVTWKHNQAGSNWTTEGGDVNVLNPNVGQSTLNRGAQAGWWNFGGYGMAKLVQEWIDGKTPNYGVMLKLQEETAHQCGPCIERMFELTSSATATKPYLSVTYVPQAPGGFIVSPIEGTRSAKRFRLEAAWSQSGVTGVTFQYLSLYEGWTTIPESKVTTRDGQSVKWPLPTNGSRRSQAIFWDAPEPNYPFPRIRGKIRAVFTGDPVAEGYTRPAELQLERDLGSPKDAVESVGPGAVDLLTGNLNVSRTDVSIPGFTADLSFTRSFNSRDANTSPTGPLGPGWTPGVPVEEAGGAAWKNIVFEKNVEEWEGKESGEPAYQTTIEYAVLTTLDGEQLAFAKEGGTYIAPLELSDWTLTESSGSLVLADPSGSTTTFQSVVGGSNEFVPTVVSQVGGPNNKSRFVYKVAAGVNRLTAAIGPSASGVECPVVESPTYGVVAAERVGCHVLTFAYQSMTAWGGSASLGERLASVTYHSATGATTMGHWQVANYSYDTQGRLTSAWDPRISPALKETYTYLSGGQIQTVTPAGQLPWTLEYGQIPGDPTNDGRLMKVKRGTLLASPATAETTLVYEVPLSGTGAPNQMSPAAVGQWGQSDVPADATAIFPPDQVPASPPSSWSHASIYYMDVEGALVNTSTPAGAGTGSNSVTTTEKDYFGNVIRSLTPQNRARALALPEGERKTRSEELDTHRRFSEDGTQLEEEWGPSHQVQLDSGTTTTGRMFTSVHYDEGWTGVGVPPHLPTFETAGVSVKGELLDQRSMRVNYDWTLREPTEKVVDPGTGHLNLIETVAYDAASGQPVEVHQPKYNATTNPAAGTKTIYYSAGASSDPACANAPQYANLPCKVLPTAQVESSGVPKLLVRQFKSYSPLGEPIEVVESAGGEASNQRKTINAYDAAGRLLTHKLEGGGTAVPTTETKYSATQGLPTVHQFVCEASCTGFDSQATIATYDQLGRMTEYEDADGGVAKETFDIDSRPATVADPKGSVTFGYDPNSGLLTTLAHSAAGTFTGTYDADGNLVERGFPNGMTAKTTYNEVDEPVGLTYTKTTNCTSGCTWYSETLLRSISGDIKSDAATSASRAFTYDKAGRLLTAAETPAGGKCTTRTYQYDADSNRESVLTRGPGSEGSCPSTGGATQSYSYDGGDRLINSGVTYDGLGRILTLPAPLAGTNALTTTYFSTDMIASQTQNGVTNSFGLDGALRQRQRLQAGGLEGTEVFHYDGPSDAPAWTQRGTAWTRNLSGVGGELVAVQDSSTGVLLKLTNLHGDIVASATTSGTATKLSASYRFDEFGIPAGGTVERYGWMGGAQRRTELASGVIQMGARSYVPSIGRFLSPDPVRGGSANAYDYGNADPVNEQDPSGGKPYEYERSGPCEGQLHVYSPLVRLNEGGYGKFYARYRLYCGARGYVVYVRKIIQRATNRTKGYIIAQSERRPDKPAAYNDHEWGNWNPPDRATQFTCLEGSELEYNYEFVFEYASIGGVGFAPPNTAGPLASGGGSVNLTAQEHCGHGPYT